MTIQALTKTNRECNLFPVSIFTSHLAEPSNHYSPQDFGLEISEAELASELSTCIPESLLDPCVPEVAPDDFEKIYQFFLA
jgi:hypothetical protein